MELALIGTIGILGYVLSGREPRAPPTDQPLPRHEHAFPFGPGTAMQRAQDRDRQQTQARWEQSLQPHVTGVVTPNTKPGTILPHFSSAAKQHTNNAMKQRRMETFVGALGMGDSETGTWRKKQEVPTMFKPDFTATAVRSGGSGGGMPMGIDQATRFVPSRLQTNVLPTQQIRVGKGLGVGLDVPAADGFHPMVRIMPKNVNEHRLNNLPGGVVHGASAVAVQPTPMVLDQQGPPRYWDQSRRPTAATKATVNAASERPHQTMGACGGRLIGEDYFGTAGQDGTYSASARPTRDRNDNNPRVHETNVTGARHGIGAFAKAEHDPTRFEAQRREQLQQYEGMVTGPAAPLSNKLFVLPQTNRSLHTTDISGNPASAVEGGRARPQDAVGRTLREQAHPPSQPGIAAPYLKGHSVQATHKWIDRDPKRYGLHLKDWLPPAHMPTDVRVPGIVQVKPRLGVLDAVPMPTNPTPSSMAPLGQTTTPQNKLPPTNTRLDLSLAATQLADNPLVQRMS
jgi:hypothetical protein